MKKLRIAILGTGNIGIDLLMKARKSPYLDPVLFIGRSEESKGIKLAKDLDIPTSIESANALLQFSDTIDLIFDATNASSHKENQSLFKTLNKYIIDLTPSRIGKMCVPLINAEDCFEVDNVNLITCGGQASIPIIYVISKAVDSIDYVELVATISSDSAGMGTRENIHEYTVTTEKAINLFTGVKKSKSILSLNPAIPQIEMRNTLFLKVKEFDANLVESEVRSVVKKMVEYVPGFKVIFGPTFQDDLITISFQVTGSGDYLPVYSGNLDIITSAAVYMAEQYHLGKVAHS